MLDSMEKILDMPWKIRNELSRLLAYPVVRVIFFFNGVSWRHNWRFYGVPIVQKHRRSQMCFGAGLQLRSTARSNPLGPYRPVTLSTWQADAVLQTGANFAMTGGTICAAVRVEIGDNVNVGANSTIMDTDFHPLDPQQRIMAPANGASAPVVIEDNVFIGMNCIILKGVTIGRNSVVGAGSVVVQNVPPNVVVAGNPARVIRSLTP
jgi:NDP-sugar pyrophosphorylase family protein